MFRSRPFLAAVLVSALISAPGWARADEGRRHRADITITYDKEFDSAHGVRSGHGVPGDPYVISGWTVNNLTISDTDAAVRIVNTTVHGTMTLNWVGPRVVVRDNDVGDLRVNENVARYGEPTSGTIAHNRFDVVGQLRHFDGTFAHNTVGSASNDGIFGSGQAVNFDGFNGAHFEHNTIYGYVDARLHGHHHSSGFGKPSHMHGGQAHDMKMEEVDHSVRYDEVYIHDNTIYATGSYALAYVDTNHAGNDRTATSETNPALNAPHTHFTRVHIVGNHLHGSGIMVDVFNARDERHIRTPHGMVEIRGNDIDIDKAPLFSTFAGVQGIQVWQARHIELRIVDNSVTAPARAIGTDTFTSTAGVYLYDLTHARVSIRGIEVSNQRYGVYATSMTRSVDWRVSRLSTQGVDQDVYYDRSVRNAPHRG